MLCQRRLYSTSRIFYKKMTSSSSPLFLGLDSSTQGLKATAVDERLGVVHRFAINYQKEFSSYGIVNGVQAKAGNVVTQPSLMVCS
jgi:xylulokinase